MRVLICHISVCATVRQCQLDSARVERSQFSNDINRSARLEPVFNEGNDQFCYPRVCEHKVGMKFINVINRTPRRKRLLAPR